MQLITELHPVRKFEVDWSYIYTRSTSYFSRCLNNQRAVFKFTFIKLPFTYPSSKFFFYFRILQYVDMRRYQCLYEHNASIFVVEAHYIPCQNSTARFCHARYNISYHSNLDFTTLQITDDLRKSENCSLDLQNISYFPLQIFPLQMRDTFRPCQPHTTQCKTTLDFN